MTSSGVAIVIPTREELARIKDPAARLLACVEPATNALIRATALPDVEEIRAQAAGIETYARTIRLSTEAIGAAQTIARRAEVRMGQLLEPKAKPPPGPGRGNKKPATQNSLPQGNEFPDPKPLSRKAKHDLRAMAEHAPAVEEVLGQLAPEGKATRKAVLGFVKSESLDDNPQMRRAEHLIQQARVPRQLLSVEATLRSILGVLAGPDVNLDEYRKVAARVVRLSQELEAVFRESS